MRYGLGDMPLWMLAPLLFLGLVLSAWIGIALRGRLRPDPADDASEGYLLSSALALLALLIGFTFSMALNRYDARRMMVVAEGNAIGTAWLRAELVTGPTGDPLRRAMRDYAAIRLQLPRSADPNVVERDTARAQAVIWMQVRAAMPTLSPPLVSPLVTATTEMFDAASTRHWEREARIPALVLDILIVSALISSAVVGYVLGGQGRRHALVTVMLFVLLSLAITLILDLDRPWSGAITISQEPMETAVAAMR